MTGTVTSADGTVIAVDRYGSGPAVVLVHGAFTGRGHPVMAGVATGLAPWFTVYDYDRRGRGGSGDTLPYAVEREVDDLRAVIGAAGGSAMVFGGSSGAALALRTAAGNPTATNPALRAAAGEPEVTNPAPRTTAGEPEVTKRALRAAAGEPVVTKVAVWEPPYHVSGDAPVLPLDFAAQLSALVAAGRRGEAVRRFMVEAAEIPPEAVAAMSAHPSWAEMEAIAHTLAYESSVLGPGNALPGAELAAITQPTLVLNGSDSPGWMGRAGEAVAAAIGGAVHRVLDDQAHNVDPVALVPELLEFFVAA